MQAIATTIPEIAPKLPAKRPKAEIVQAQPAAVAVTVATDFKEDPFQNYRYEDPFMIADPFQDEDEEKKNEDPGSN